MALRRLLSGTAWTAIASTALALIVLVIFAAGGRHD